MNIKEAIYKEITENISLISDYFDTTNVWQGFIPRNKTEHQSDTPDYQLFFIPLPTKEYSLIKQNIKIFEFRIVGRQNETSDNQMEIFRNIIVDHFLDNYGKGGKIYDSFTVYSCTTEQGGEVENFDSDEKEIYFQLRFDYIRGDAESL